MWEFFGIIIDQLTETFRWFLYGFFGTIALLIALYRYKLLYNKRMLGFIKKVSYYLFMPIYVAFVCWMLSATILVEKDAKQLAQYSLEQVETSYFTKFLIEAADYSAEWVSGEINSKEQLIDTYINKNGFTEGKTSTKAIKWTLEKGLDYVLEKAIEQGKVNIGDETINFPLLIQEYLLCFGFF